MWGEWFFLYAHNQRAIGLQISHKVTSLVNNYGSFFIQYPRFTYIHIGGFQDCPLMLPHFADDRLVLVEVCSWIGLVKKKCSKKRSIPFPISIGYYNCLSSSDAQNIERSMVKITFKSFQSHFPFDGSGYVENNLILGFGYLHFPMMEDYWKNYENDFEVRKKDWMRLTVQKIID